MPRASPEHLYYSTFAGCQHDDFAAFDSVMHGRVQCRNGPTLTPEQPHWATLRKLVCMQSRESVLCGNGIATEYPRMNSIRMLPTWRCLHHPTDGTHERVAGQAQHAGAAHAISQPGPFAPPGLVAPHSPARCRGCPCPVSAWQDRRPSWRRKRSSLPKQTSRPPGTCACRR